MPRGHPDGDWTDRLYRILIDAGIHGVVYSELRRALNNTASKKELDDELAYLYAKQMVDQYSIPATTKGPDATIWRATNKLMFNTGEG